MIDKELTRAERITDQRAAAALTDPMLRRLVLIFAREARSIGDVAAQTGIELKRLHYHVTRLCRIGLLEVDGELRRAGRPIKLYRASAERYFIPCDVAPELFSEPLSRELRGRIWTENLEAGNGMLLTTDDRGLPLMRPIPDGRSPARATEFWRVLRLDAVEAKSLERDLKDVLDRHASQATGRGKPYLVHAALAQRLGETVTVDNRRRS